MKAVFHHGNEGVKVLREFTLDWLLQSSFGGFRQIRFQGQSGKGRMDITPTLCCTNWVNDVLGKANMQFF
jgi:hypothetical protein